jgi:UPF0755 protein
MLKQPPLSWKIFLKRFNWIALGTLSVLVAAWIGWALWYHANLAPVSASEVTVNFSVDAGQNTKLIAERLVEQKLIKNAFVFEAYVTIHGFRDNMQAGVYQLAPNMTSQVIAKKIAKGEVIQKRVTIPEGSTLAQIKEKVVAQGVNAADWDAALKKTYGHSFLASKPAGVDLEGYLFPDSYNIDPNTSAEQVVRLMLDNFGRKVTPDIEAAFKARGYNLHQGLTIASMIEKEVSRAEDQPRVAQVIYSRLANRQLLQIDATVIYAGKLDRKNSEAIAAAIRNLESPYNTYKHAGLPPGPISSPGLATLRAAANPANTNFLFYLSDNQGNTHFAQTAAEHEQNIQKYLR